MTTDVRDDAVQNIVVTKYSTPEMRAVFTEHEMIRTWRRLWIALAEAERELGVKQITKLMIAQMRANIDAIDFAAAREREAQEGHDVMAHIYAYGLACPDAKPIIHLGATSQYVKCNTDLLLQHRALLVLRGRLVALLRTLERLIVRTRAVPCLSYTHFQPAQPTTLGRRFSTYAYDLVLDLEQLDQILASFRLLGAKGATGTQASFLTLLKSPKKVRALDLLVAKKLGFSKTYPIATQTYTRKEDLRIAAALASMAATIKRLATDLRLLSHERIVEEPIGSRQTGSSAMPYKRNPILCERVSSLARKVMTNVNDFSQVYAEQWLERTLDDSAVRRIDIPENFLLSDYLLFEMTRILDGLVVFEKVSLRLLDEEFPFLATEEILMESVRRGGDRQAVHEALKELSFAVTKAMKLEGKKNDLFDRIAADERIPLDAKDLAQLRASTALLGLSRDQVDSFLCGTLRPAIKRAVPSQRGMRGVA